MKNVIILFGLILLTSCGEVNTENNLPINDKILKNETSSEIETNLSEFDYKLPQSNYSYKIKITDIKIKTVKNSFTSKSSEYSVAKNVNGNYLTITYSMTNPYNEEMMAPVPDYYYISSLNGEWFSNSTCFNRECHCEIDNSTKVTNDKGIELNNLSDSKCGNSNYCIKFKAKETKNFKIKFTDAIFGEVKKIVFNGFNLNWNNPSYTSPQDKGLIINIDSLKIIGEKKY